MRTTTSLALASILTLGIAGASPALAGGATSTAPIRLFGKSMCLPSTPATARCDVRLAPPAPGVVRVFGKTWCFVAPADTRCDLTMPAPSGTTAAAAPATAAPPTTSAPPDEGVFGRWLRALRARASSERG